MKSLISEIIYKEIINFTDINIIYPQLLENIRNYQFRVRCPFYIMTLKSVP